MNVLPLCPCCHQPWRAPTLDRMPLVAVRELALEFVIRETGLRHAALVCRRRSTDLVRARALFVWIVKTYGPADLSYTRIGKWLNKDHSSICHLWHEVIPRLQARDLDFVSQFVRFPAFVEQASEPPQ